MKKRALAILLAAMLVMSMASCGKKDEKDATTKTKDDVTTTTTEAETPVVEETKLSGKLVVYSPHPLEFMDPLIQEFENRTGVSVEVIAAGTGELIKRIEAEAGNAQGDIMWGGTIALLGTNTSIFEQYTSVNEDAILPDYKNKTGAVTAFTVVPSVLVVNTNLAAGIEINGYEDLLNPELKGKIAHCDPAKSSSSFEHVINMLNAMGNGDPEAGWDFTGKFIKNLDGKLLSGSSAVYKGVADGEYTVGLTFEEGAVKSLVDGAPVEVVYMEEGVICRADGIAVIKDAANIENAKAFIDFVTSKEAQEIVIAKLNRRTVRNDVGSANGLTAYEDIKILNDDVDWATSNKQAVLDKFKDLFTSN
ncbi:MAG: transporter substrate-binding protein [Clostridiales bacterium]|jgi:iron(III) transport system substrate-binding protein|nr:transporter substrate-binding protein [Clostridiales bacterium]